MGLARSTYYDEIKGQPIEEGRLMAHITEICAEFPRYGYRRITAQLREDGIIVNHKKVMRLMKEHGLTVQPRAGRSADDRTRVRRGRGRKCQ